MRGVGERRDRQAGARAAAARRRAALTLRRAAAPALLSAARLTATHRTIQRQSFILTRYDYGATASTRQRHRRSRTTDVRFLYSCAPVYVT